MQTLKRHTFQVHTKKVKVKLIFERSPTTIKEELFYLGLKTHVKVNHTNTHSGNLPVYNLHNLCTCLRDFHFNCLSWFSGSNETKRLNSKMINFSSNIHNKAALQSLHLCTILSNKRVRIAFEPFFKVKMYCISLFYSLEIKIEHNMLRIYFLNFATTNDQNKFKFTCTLCIG